MFNVSCMLGIIAQYYVGGPRASTMPKVSLDMPTELMEDLRMHVGDDKKFVSFADAVRTACRKMLDHLDEVDRRHGRGELS